MEDLQLHSESHPSFHGFSASYTNNGDQGTLQPSASNSHSLCSPKSPTKPFGSSKRKSWLLCGPSEMPVQETVVEDDNYDSRSLSFRIFIDEGNDRCCSDSSASQKSHSPPLSSFPPLPVLCKELRHGEDRENEEDEEEDKSIGQDKNGDDKNHSFRFFQYILEDRAEEELNFDVFETSKENFTSSGQFTFGEVLNARNDDSELIKDDGSQFLDTQTVRVSGSPNSSLQTRKKNSPTSNHESISALKLAQRALSRGRFGRMLNAAGSRKKLFEMFSPEKFKKRLLALAMQMNAKTKKALALKNDTSDRINNNEEEEFWKKKILLGRRCKPLKMDDDDDEEAYEESSRAAKVVPWVTIEENLGDHTKKKVSRA